MNDLSFPVNFSGSTQFGSSFSVNAMVQDGYGSGSLAGFNVGEDGTILGRYTNGQTSVVGQVILEAVFITALAGWMGLVLGVFLMEGIAGVVPGSEFFRDPTIQVDVAIYALIALIVSGALAGFIPARRAAAIRPIEALRDE